MRYTLMDFVCHLRAAATFQIEGWWWWWWWWCEGCDVILLNNVETSETHSPVFWNMIDDRSTLSFIPISLPPRTIAGES